MDQGPAMYTVPKVINFPRYNTKCSGENEILRGIFRVLYRFSQHFVLYLGNLNYFFDSVAIAHKIDLPNVLFLLVTL